MRRETGELAYRREREVGGDEESEGGKRRERRRRRNRRKVGVRKMREEINAGIEREVGTK